VSRVALVGELDVRGLLATAAAVVLDFEGDFVAFVEGGYAAPLERRSMHKYVLATIFRLNEAESACMIEEFHCAIDTRHGGKSFPVKLNINGPQVPRGDLRRLEMSGKVVLLWRDSHLPSSKSAPKALGAR